MPRKPHHGISRRVARGVMIFGFAKPEDDPSWRAAQAIKGKFERERAAAGPVRTLEEMTDAEIDSLEAQYSCRVRRPRGKGDRG